ncbi:MAG: OsmC family protein [Candidatus Binatia bacterium]
MAEHSAGKSELPGGMPGRPIGTVRVDITRQEHKTFEAVFKTEDKSFQRMIDEPEIRGGKGSGPTPLGYFVTGAASCLVMQYANVLKEKPMPVESIKMLARAYNDREARVFTDMIYQVDLTGSLSEADAETLAKAASERCFVENTMAKAIPITTEVHLNGKKVVTFTRDT